MSSVQADLLTSELESYRRVLTPVILRVARAVLRIWGEDPRCSVEWDDITLADEVELARAQLLRAQAEKMKNENAECRNREEDFLMDIQKLMEQTTEPTPGTPGEEDLALIHTWTRRELAPEELYVFRANLCDNEIDRDGERFTRAALEALAGLFVGKTGLFDHSGKTGDQVMRVYAAEVVDDPARATKTGEPYAALRVKAYLLRGGENEALIRAIDGGIKKEVSVSCAVKRVACSVCGRAYGRDGCSHRKGEAYDGALCHAVLDEPTDAYEFSFVAVPAQPAAGIVKRRQGSGVRRQESDAEMRELRGLAEDGRAYRAELLEKTLRAAAIAVPGIARETLRSMCSGLPAGELRELCGTLEAQASRTLPLKGQLIWGAKQGEGIGNEGYRV
jgi:hypothetical protein